MYKRQNWHTWKYQCQNGHIKGEKYDGKPCVGDLIDPTDAYEFSFVAVPSQRGAGVTKSAKNLEDAFESLMTGDLSGHVDKIKMLMPLMQSVLMDAEQREKRAKILADNEKYLKK